MTPTLRQLHLVAKGEDGRRAFEYAADTIERGEHKPKGPTDGVSTPGVAPTCYRCGQPLLSPDDADGERLCPESGYSLPCYTQEAPDADR